jgi:hypothetical protein
MLIEWQEERKAGRAMVLEEVVANQTKTPMENASVTSPTAATQEELTLEPIVVEAIAKEVCKMLQEELLVIISDTLNEARKE